MPDLSFNKYLSAFKSFRGLVTSVGVIIPGLSYFTLFVPPLMPKISIITAVIAVAVVLLTYYYKPRQNDSQSVKSPESNLRRRLPPIARLAVKVLIGSVILLILYQVFLGFCTVTDLRGEERYQIGFYKMEWSLTKEGKEVKSSHPNETIQDWMMNDQLFKNGGPEVIWKVWTIYLSGVLLILIYLFSFVLWVFGWALLAKQKVLEQNGDAH